MNLKRELIVCKELAVMAGEEIIKVYESDFDITYKYDKSPLTKADKKANEIIVNGLKENFPDYAILSEENYDDKARLNNDYSFIVDPLDGTKEFIKKNDEFTVNIALSYKNRSVLGVIYVPVTKELFFAYKGLGAYYEVDKLNERIHVSDRRKNIRFMMSRSHVSDELLKLLETNNIKDIKRVGSSLKGCLIARGEAECYYRFGNTMEWDTAAMQCIIEEAGGVFKQMDNTDMLYNRESTLNDKGFYILNCKDNILKFIKD